MIRSLALVAISQSCGPVRWVWVIQPDLKEMIDKGRQQNRELEVAVILRTSYPTVVKLPLLSLTYLAILSCATSASPLLAALFQSFS
jgi:hypothetical protein